MTEMAPEQPIPDQEFLMPEVELKISYTFEEEKLTVTSTAGGAAVELTMDYAVEEVREQADLLVQSIPSMVEAVLMDIEQKVAAL